MLLEERKRQQGKWEYFQTKSLAEVIKVAKTMGWALNKVQVREYQTGINEFWYAIEPFENCGCSNLLKYDDYKRVEETLPLGTE